MEIYNGYGVVRYTNGKIKEIGSVDSSGLKQGDWYMFSVSGKQTFLIKYFDGHIIWSWCYTFTGKTIFQTWQFGEVIKTEIIYNN